MECLGGAVKEFVPLILFFFSSFFFLRFFFSAVSLLQLRRDGRRNRGGPGGRGLHGGAPTKRDCLVQFSVSTAGAFVGGGRVGRCGGRVRLAKWWG